MNHVTYMVLSPLMLGQRHKLPDDLFVSLASQGETTERCSVVVLVPHFFTWKHFLFETVAALDLGIVAT
jgi:hypothetical protein